MERKCTAVDLLESSFNKTASDKINQLKLKELKIVQVKKVFNFFVLKNFLC